MAVETADWGVGIIAIAIGSVRYVTESPQLRDIPPELVQHRRVLLARHDRPRLLRRLALDVLHRDAVPVAADDGGDGDGGVGLDEAQGERLVGVVLGVRQAVAEGAVIGDGVAVVDDVAPIAVVDDVAGRVGGWSAVGRRGVAVEGASAVEGGYAAGL